VKSITHLIILNEILAGSLIRGSQSGALTWIDTFLLPYLPWSRFARRGL